MGNNLNGRTAGLKGKIRENPGKNVRVDRYGLLCLLLGYVKLLV